MYAPNAPPKVIENVATMSLVNVQLKFGLGIKQVPKSEKCFYFSIKPQDNLYKKEKMFHIPIIIYFFMQISF